MCLIRTEHLTGILLFVIIVLHAKSSFNTLTHAASLNTPEEIKRIFNCDQGVKDKVVSHTNGIPESGNFAEGGLLNVNISPTVDTDPTKKIDSFLSNHKSISGNNITKNLNESSQNNIKSYKNSTLHKLSTNKTLLPTKLNDTGSNLFLGVPEVIHINGTSSIKPRKGVYYNKIVPRKGVENENGANHNNSDLLCVQLGDNECYNSKELNDVDCDCCKEGNALGKTIRQKDPVTCQNCKPVIFEFPDGKHICENICCYDKFYKAVSVSNTQDIFYKNVSFTPRTEFKNENTSSNEKIKELTPNRVNLIKNSKHKPSITKVPYDVEVMTEILSKAKQKVFVPVIVSILLLPLIGVLVFVVLRKMKEIWDKRYYKRMDFLIDGMYQE